MNFPLSEIQETSFIEGLISIWGDFGVGKTIFALQTIRVFLEKDQKVLFVYTKPIFPYKELQNVLKEKYKEKEIPLVLENLSLINCTSFEELYSFIYKIEFSLLKNKKGKKKNIPNLIVIDSITNLYRLELNKEQKPTNIKLNFQLNEILGQLTYLNHHYHIEVLLTNELSRKRIEDNYVEIQSGGKVMEYWTTLSIKIQRTPKHSVRKFIIQKHPRNNVGEFVSKLSEIGFISI
ncbi:MAG: DNA repair and recombination protein RadB [Promethearchaeota archaeon]|nr:MAG: DNA repair and recombination protein RadB [Candidatus Lokiarchaeota archaeon]